MPSHNWGHCEVAPRKWVGTSGQGKEGVEEVDDVYRVREGERRGGFGNRRK